ncbi:MAG TPA: xanthine dehydrogenase family protein molybdopterin-binding subunit [Acidimicrobiales bacterium]|jgi:carbon-monoxide dehydrogenase large subunit|nr:xanthine dehydrogenase family protein molybdopterin-binding subunit [Acidimicrobiales bacterium]
MTGRFTGQSVERVEDARLLRGQGRFAASIQRPHLTYATFVRSPHAHARIRSIDVSAAQAFPGVVAVLTAADLDPVMTAPMTLIGPPALKVAPYGPLADDKVRLVGDPVAIVIAESEAIACDARDLVSVDYEPIAPVVTMDVAVSAASVPLWEELGTNVAFHDVSTWGDVDTAFAQADHVISRRFVQHRFSHAPMEPRSGVADFDPATGQLTYEPSHKRPHSLKLALSGLLGIPFPDIRVIARDIGGGFGSKGQITRDDIALCTAARILGRPIKWVETRGENLMVAGHAREETVEVDAAVSADGRVHGLRVRMVLDAGAYPMLPFPASFFATLVGMLLPNAYKIDAYSFESTVVYTNKASYISYRGPWAVETWVREAILDTIGRRLGITPEDMRRRNLYAGPDLPARMTTGASLQDITALETLERAVELMDPDGFRKEQEVARAEGRYLGLGFATFIEIAPGPPDFAKMLGFDLPSETAWARIEPTGHLTITTWQHSQGQSHETTIAQVAADELGVPFDHVRVVYGDSSASPFTTMGTGGSRAATMGSGSAVGATRIVKDMALRIAAQMLEANEADLEIVDAEISVRGTPSKRVALADVARAAWFAPSSLPEGLRQGLEATCDFRVPERGGWTAATHCCWVDIDLDTGAITIPRYLVVEDCGTLINPAIVDGQIVGGVVQGLAGVLYEKHVFDDDGQLLTASFTDYLVPSAADLPSIEIEHMEFEPLHEINSRGVGEGGMIGAPAALCNAVADALAPLGIEVDEQHLSPSYIRSLLRDAPFWQEKSRL